MHRMLRGFALACALAVPLAALAQYPAKPIRLIVPFPPSGSAGRGGRSFAPPPGQQGPRAIDKARRRKRHQTEHQSIE